MSTFGFFSYLLPHGLNNKHLFDHNSLDWQFGYTQLGFF